MAAYETDRDDFEAKWEARERRIIMYVGLHGFARHTELGGIRDGLLAILQFGRAVRQGVLAVYGTEKPDHVVATYSAHLAMLSFPFSDAHRVVTCATAIFREMDDVNRARAGGKAAQAVGLRCKAGIAAGEIIVDLHAHAPGAQTPVGEPVDVAWQLANIARPWQILVDQRYDNLVRDFDLTTIGGETGILEPRPGLDKRVKGYKDLVKVSAFVWNGSPSPSTIRNSPVLQGELEALEGTIAEFLHQENYVYRMTQRELLEENNVAASLGRVEALPKGGRPRRSEPWVGVLARVRKTFNDSTEAKQEKTLQVHVLALEAAYERAKESLRALAKASQVDQDDLPARQADPKACLEQVFGVFEAARKLQVSVNTLLRESE